MSVYVITYGYVDLEEESICAIWDDEQKAIENAEYLCQEAIDDAGLGEDGYYYVRAKEMYPEDYPPSNPESDSIILHNPSGMAVEWWRITKHEVLS